MALALAHALWHIPRAHSVSDMVFLPAFWVGSLAVGIGFVRQGRWGFIALPFLALILVTLTGKFFVDLWWASLGENFVSFEEDPLVVRVVAGIIACYFLIGLFTAIVTWRFRFGGADT